MITDSHVRSQVAPYDHAEDVSIFSDIALQFRQAMSLDRSVKMKYEVSSINKVSLREWLCLLNLPPLAPPPTPTQPHKLAWCYSTPLNHKLA